eukprot:COSAG03_NODE_7502_length_908_cov_72.435105_2_plen_134_part_00
MYIHVRSSDLLKRSAKTGRCRHLPGRMHTTSARIGALASSGTNSAARRTMSAVVSGRTSLPHSAIRLAVFLLHYYMMKSFLFLLCNRCGSRAFVSTMRLEILGHTPPDLKRYQLLRVIHSLLFCVYLSPSCSR